MSLALFALKDYRGAAMEAHAAVALGPISDWAQLYSYYGNVEPYTKQLDALVDYVHKNRSSAEGRFLLAYHDLMMGHTPEGKEQLTQAIALAPQDKVAQQLMAQLGGTAVTATMPAPPPPPPQPQPPQPQSSRSATPPPGPPKPATSSGPAEY